MLPTRARGCLGDPRRHDGRRGLRVRVRRRQPVASALERGAGSHAGARRGRARARGPRVPQAPHPGRPRAARGRAAFGGSDDHRGDPGTRARVRLEGTAPPRGPSDPPRRTARARAPKPRAGFRMPTARHTARNAESWPPSREQTRDAAPRGAPRPPPPGAVSRGFDGSPSTFDDPPLDDIDVDALVKQRQNSLPPAARTRTFHRRSGTEPTRDAPAAPETAAALRWTGRVEWREHGARCVRARSWRRTRARSETCSWR